MIISRYLTRSVLTVTFAITLVLVLAFVSQQMVRYLSWVAMGKIPTSILLQLVSFEVPYLLALLLPLGLYLGILLAFGRLYIDNEMAIMQMSGVGQGDLVRLSLFLMMLFTAFILFLMLYLNPWISTKRLELINSDEATLHMIQTLIPGRFQVSPDGKNVMYVEKLSRNHERAEGVFLAANTPSEETEINPPWKVVFAQEGYQLNDKSTKDKYFVTRVGHRYEGTPGQNDYRITQFNRYEIRIPQNDVKTSHEAEESTPSLYLWKHYDDPNNAAELQWRISMGIACLLLGLLAIPLSARQPRKSRYLTIFPAIIFYIIYFNVLLVAKHWVELGKVSIAMGVWWVHGMVILLILFIYFFTQFRPRWS